MSLGTTNGFSIKLREAGMSGFCGERERERER